MNAMNFTFYTASAIALFSTLQAITQIHAVKALLYLMVSFLSVAVIFFILGAPLAAALEVMIYVGAILVVFVFVIMMLNQGPLSAEIEKRWLRPGIWLAPSLLGLFLFCELTYVLVLGSPGSAPLPSLAISPEQVGTHLLGPYGLGVELASLLLLSGLIGAYHLGYPSVQIRYARREQSSLEKKGGSHLRLVSNQKPSRPARRQL